MPHTQQIYQQLTADEYRRARLMHVKREVEKLKREEAPPLEALSRAAIEALAERLTHASRQSTPVTSPETGKPDG